LAALKLVFKEENTVKLYFLFIAVISNNFHLMQTTTAFIDVSYLISSDLWHVFLVVVGICLSEADWSATTSWVRQ